MNPAANQQQPPPQGPFPEGEGRPQREVAQRVFAAEFNLAAHSYKEDGDRSPTFVVSPFGAKVNRLFAVGVLTSVEAVGQTGDRFRAQIVDPTGTFNVYSGQYEPEATQQLNELRPPVVVAVVGKSRTYQPDTGVTYVSVRPETIRAVEKHDRDAWVIETARLSLQRLDALREAMKLEKPTPKQLEDLGYPKDVAEGVVRALEHYGPADAAKYATMVRDALESLLPGGAAERVTATPDFATASSAYTPQPPATPRPASQMTPSAAPKPAAAAPTPENPHKELVLALVEKLDDGKGAPWEDIVGEAAKKGVKETEVEECLNSLMDDGQVYEPVLGRLKKT